MKHLIACSAILLAACSGQQGSADAPDASAANDGNGGTATSEPDGGAVASRGDMASTDENMESNPDAGGAPSTAPAPAPADAPATSATAGAPKNVGKSIPARYHGDWALKAADCDVQPDFYAIHISANRIGYFETSGDVQRVESDGRYAAVGLAETVGPGVERYTLYLALQPDGRLRTRRGADGEAKLYVACPSG